MRCRITARWSELEDTQDSNFPATAFDIFQSEILPTIIWIL